MKQCMEHTAARIPERKLDKELDKVELQAKKEGIE